MINIGSGSKPVVVRDGYDLMGGMTRKTIIKTLNLDPLYGCDYPVRTKETVPLLYENDYSDDDEGGEGWRNYLLDYDEVTILSVITAPIFATIMIGSKIVGNLILAVSGVVFSPVFINSRTYILNLRDHLEYVIFRYKHKNPFTWESFLKKLDSFGVPKPEVVRVRQEIQERSMHDKYRARAKRYLKIRPAYYQYFEKIAVAKPLSNEFTSIPLSVFKTQFIKHAFEFFENHPIGKLNKEYRAAHKVPNYASLRFFTKLSFVGKWLFPKVKSTGFAVTGLMPYILRNLKPYFIQTPYLFAITTINIYLGSIINDLIGKKFKKMIPISEGLIFGSSILMGIQQFAYFIGKTDIIIPRMKLSQAPKFFLGWVLWGAFFQAWMNGEVYHAQPSDYLHKQDLAIERFMKMNWRYPNEEPFETFNFFNSWRRRFREQRRRINQQLRKGQTIDLPEKKLKERILHNLDEHKLDRDPQSKNRRKFYENPENYG